MKLICLNTWKGKLSDSFIEFIRHEADKTDIFCFQEVTHLLKDDKEDTDLFSIISDTLSDFQGFFEAPDIRDYNNEIGLAIFIKKNLTKENSFVYVRKKEIMVSRNDRIFAKNAQIVRLSRLGKDYTIINFHGLWEEGIGQDTAERINQFKKLKTILEDLPGRKIICGDFNVSPETECIKIMDNNMKNLIADYSIISTRSGLFPRPNVVCDYVFVDPNVIINNFKTLPDQISDHLALFLDFN